MSETENMQDATTTDASATTSATDEKRARYEQLKSMERSGEMSDADRAELEQLRNSFESE